MRFIRGSVFSLAAAGLGRGFAAVASIVAARVLGKVQFGELAMVNSTMGLFGIVAGFGFGLTATKHIAELSGVDPSRAGRIVGLLIVGTASGAALISLPCLVAPGVIASAVLNQPNLAGALRAGTAFLLVTTLSGALNGALVGFEAFRAIAWIALWQGVAVVPATFVLARFAGVSGAVTALTLSGLLGLVLVGRQVHAECKARGIAVSVLGGLRSERNILWGFSLPSMLSNVAVGAGSWAASALLANRPGGYAELGLFGAANQWRSLVLFIPLALSNVALPMMSEALGRSASGDALALSKVNLDLVWMIAIPTTVVGICGSDLLASLYGRSFQGASVPVAIMVVAAFLDVTGMVWRQVLVASSQMWVAAVGSFAWATGLVLACLGFGSQLGAIGLTSGYALAFLLQAVVAGVALRRCYGRGSFGGFWPRAAGVVILLSLAAMIRGAESPVLIAGLLVILVGGLVFSWVSLPRGIRVRLRQIDIRMMVLGLRG